MEPELRLLDGRRARHWLHPEGPGERDPSVRYARAGAVRTSEFDKSIGIDPARVRDFFSKAVSVLPRVRTEPWLPSVVWVDRHRGKRLTAAYRELVFELSAGGPLARFSDFRWLVVDATHDPKFAEDLEEMWPGRAEGLHITSEARERLLRATWLWFRLGGSLPGRTGNRDLDANIAETRREMERLELKLTPNGKLKVDHRYNEHNDLADAVMFSLLRPMEAVRRLLGGTRAAAAPASAPHDPFEEDPMLAAVTSRILPPNGWRKKW